MIELRPVIFINGILLATLGCAMMLPALYDLAVGNDDWLVFTAAAIITLFVGVGMVLANQGQGKDLSIRQAFLMTNLAWILITTFGALPFAWSKLDLSYTDAFFEAMSGITTTGATVVVGLDTAPPGILLWRGLLQWLGGLGVIVMAMAVLPMLKVGGMQLFRVEAFDTAGKILPRAAQIAGSLTSIYLGFTMVGIAAYYIAGMTAFEAVVHSMTTIATGGYSTSDASLGHFDSTAIELTCIVLMIIGSLPFALYVRALSQGVPVVFKDAQVRWFFSILAIFTVMAVFAQVGHNETLSWVDLREALFNVTSIMTGTGYSTVDYDNWGTFAVTVFFLATFIGGCSGSTSCGIKVFRFQVLHATVKQAVVEFMQPNRVYQARVNGRPVTPQVSVAVVTFFFMFSLSVAIIAFLLGLMGLDTVTALSAAATSVANVGPGLGPTVGPAGNFSTLPDMAKWLLSFGMLLGRLELLTVLVLFTPTFWR